MNLSHFNKDIGKGVQSNLILGRGDIPPEENSSSNMPKRTFWKAGKKKLQKLMSVSELYQEKGQEHMSDESLRKYSNSSFGGSHHTSI